MSKMLTLVAVCLSVFVGSVQAAAIFTTLADGSAVNANIYKNAEDVYLDGGHGPNAPQGAVVLPDGDYVFQVTDTSGEVLLSKDIALERIFKVQDGVIAEYLGFTHLTDIDYDHGAVTIQLMPFKQTLNKGEGCKVWVTLISDFESAGGDLSQVKQNKAGGFFGFVPNVSKTDNFSCRQRGNTNFSLLCIQKFYDNNADRVWDETEEEVIGWAVDITDPLGVTNTYYTPVQILATPAGNWVVKEDEQSGWKQTALYVDGDLEDTALETTVIFVGSKSERHDVIFGNIAE